MTQPTQLPPVRSLYAPCFETQHPYLGLDDGQLPAQNSHPHMVPSQNINHQFQRQQPGYYHQSSTMEYQQAARSMYSQPTSYDNPPVNRIALHSHPGPIFGTLSCSYCGCRDLKAEGGWKVCAHCGTRVTENSPDYSLQQQSSSLEHPPPRPLPNHVMMRHSYSPPISPPFLADAHRFGSASSMKERDSSEKQSPLPPPPSSSLYALKPSQQSFSSSQPQTPQTTRFQPTHSVCSNCNITATTLWRKAADGKTLCNPCGLFLKKNGTERKVAVVEDLPPLITKKSPISRVRKEKAGGGVDNWGQNISCSNCSTRETTLWRRNDEGLPICNACGLYKRLHGIDRPHDLKSEVIRRRKRGPRVKQPPVVAGEQKGSDQGVNESKLDPCSLASSTLDKTKADALVMLADASNQV